MSEKEAMYEVAPETVEIFETSPLNFGNPNASISYALQKERGELRDDVEAAMVEFMTSGECLVDSTEEDDGCIDGRSVMKVTYVDIAGDVKEVQVEHKDTVHERPKVAGGGYMTALAMEFAFFPPLDGVDVTLKHVATQLATRELFCGAHSGDHENPHLGSTDCGANDKVLPIFVSGITYKQQIADKTNDLLAIAGVAYSSRAQDQVMAGWNDATRMEHAFTMSTGRSRYETIMAVLREAQRTHADTKEKPLGVIKHLKGDHKEACIFINYVTGKTFSQATLRKLLMRQFPNIDETDIPQTFVVDVPRIVQLAEAMTHDPRKRDIVAPMQGDSYQNAFMMALQAGVSYQLATAATLTDGSLRVLVSK